MGTQKVWAPESVCQGDWAKLGKFSIPDISVSSARWPALNRARESSNGRQVMRSPALPPFRLAHRVGM